MYNRRRGNLDFFVFEIFDGYLWFIIDLGFGVFKDKIVKKINDKMLYYVILKYFVFRKSGLFFLDNEVKDYIVLGNSINLNLDGEFYVGGFGIFNEGISKDFWVGIFGYGYVGCM